MLIPVQPLILCATLLATHVTLINLSSGPMGGNLVQEVSSNTCEMAPVRSSTLQYCRQKESLPSSVCRPMNSGSLLQISS